MMLKGSKLVKKVPGRGGWELRLVVQGGLRILDKIEALGFDTLQQRPKLSAWDVAVMGWRALWMYDWSRPAQRCPGCDKQQPSISSLRQSPA